MEKDNSLYKFRAWDKINKVMLYDGITLDMSDCSRHSTFLNFKKPIPELITLMQFTGLYDKNGQEIYAGDIVKKQGHNSSKEFLYVIAWKNKWACFFAAVAKKTDGYLSCYPSLESGEEFAHHTAPAMEVIGNKFQNPELIKESE